MPALLRFTDKGIYCPAGDFYIDPWRGVNKAVITHAHSDHARWGSKHYLAHKDSAPILRLRLGADINLETIDYSQAIFMNGVQVSLHPAGHIIGSAQVRVEYKGDVWVVSGDYKLENDHTCQPFEPVTCNTFISESTFGLPVYRWKTQSHIFNHINHWWAHNKAQNKTSVLLAYSLGKAQRVLHSLDKSIGSIYAHTATYNVQQALIKSGLPLYDVKQWTPAVSKGQAPLIVAPSSALNSPWLNRFEPYAVGVCSGWMQVRGAQRRQNVDAGFALSDHADWEGLLTAVKATGASKVFITHGYQSVFSRYLNDLGIESEEVITEYGDEAGEDAEVVV